MPATRIFRRFALRYWTESWWNRRWPDLRRFSGTGTYYNKTSNTLFGVLRRYSGDSGGRYKRSVRRPQKMDHCVSDRLRPYPFQMFRYELVQWVSTSFFVGLARNWVRSNHIPRIYKLGARWLQCWLLGLPDLRKSINTIIFTQDWLIYINNILKDVHMLSAS